MARKKHERDAALDVASGRPSKKTAATIRAELADDKGGGGSTRDPDVSHGKAMTDTASACKVLPVKEKEDGQQDAVSELHTSNSTDTATSTEPEQQLRPTNTTMPSSFIFPPLRDLNAGGVVNREKTNINSLMIVCYNVAGLNAALKKGFIDYVRAEDADILCISETKLAEEPAEGLLRDLYPHQYWSKLPAATPKKGPYYGGVALLSKIPPKSCDFTALAGHLDDEGRAFVATFASSSSISSSSPSFTNSDGGFHLLHTYVPNASQGLKRLKEKQEYNAAVERLMARLDTQLPVIWCGDLNVAHQDIDLTNPKTNRKSPGFTNEERSDFSRILSAGRTTATEFKASDGDPYVDVWRALHPGIVDYSYFGYRFNCRKKYIGWRLDYFVASRRLMPFVRDCVMRTVAYGASDHVPIVLVLRNVLQRAILK